MPAWWNWKTRGTQNPVSPGDVSVRFRPPAPFTFNKLYQICNVAYHPTYCYKFNWQWTSCPSVTSGSVGGSVCGNGICEVGESVSKCGQDCCDQYIAYGPKEAEPGALLLCNVFHYEWPFGYAYWRGFNWITDNDTMQMCDESWEAQEASYHQAQSTLKMGLGKFEPVRIVLDSFRGFVRSLPSQDPPSTGRRLQLAVHLG